MADDDEWDEINYTSGRVRYRRGVSPRRGGDLWDRSWEASGLLTGRQTFGLDRDPADEEFGGKPEDLAAFILRTGG